MEQSFGLVLDFPVTFVPGSSNGRTRDSGSRNLGPNPSPGAKYPCWIFFCVMIFPMKVLIVLPTYNEKENIRTIIERIFKVDSRYHVLVVDDNSPDKTALVVKRLQQKNPKIKLIERDFKEGIGPAYIVGFNFALKHKFDFIVQMDADLSHDPNLIPEMLALTFPGHWVIGSRYVPGGSIRGWEKKRVIISWFGNWYTKLVLGFTIKDWTAGFNLWPRKILEAIKLQADEFPNGYAFQIALKYKALKKGFRPIEVPIIFRDRRRGKTKIGGGILNEAAVTVLRLRLTRNHRLNPLKMVK